MAKGTSKQKTSAPVFVGGMLASEELIKKLRAQSPELDKLLEEKVAKTVEKTIKKAAGEVKKKAVEPVVEQEETQGLVPYTGWKEMLSDKLTGRGWNELKGSITDVVNNPFKKNKETGKRHLINPNLKKALWQNKGRIALDALSGGRYTRFKDDWDDKWGSGMAERMQYEQAGRKSLADRVNSSAVRKQERLNSSIETATEGLSNEKKGISSDDKRIAELQKLVEKTGDQSKISKLAELLTKKKLKGEDFSNLSEQFAGIEKASLKGPGAEHASSLGETRLHDKELHLEEETYEEQEAIHNLLSKKFDVLDVRLQEIKKAIEMSGEGGGLLDAAGKGGAAAAGLAALKALVKKAAPKAVATAKWAGRANVAVNAGMGAYEAYSGVQEADRLLEEGQITEAEAKQMKRLAIGRGAGSAIGSTIGGVAGAALGPLGVVAGSYVGEKLGRWGGEKFANYLGTVGNLESGLNPNAKAGTSSASGMFQFTEGTWKDLAKKHGKNYSLEDRFDPQKSAEMAALFTLGNKKTLEKNLGRDVNETELYMAHFMGAGSSKAGATKFLQAKENNPNAIAANIFGREAAANKNIFYDKSGRARTVGEVYGLMDKKYKNKEVITPMSFDETDKEQYTITEGEQEQYYENMKQKNTMEKAMVETTVAKNMTPVKVAAEKPMTQIVPMPVGGGSSLVNRSIFDDISFFHTDSGLLNLNLLT